MNDVIHDTSSSFNETYSDGEAQESRGIFSYSVWIGWKLFLTLNKNSLKLLHIASLVELPFSFAAQLSFTMHIRYISYHISKGTNWNGKNDENQILSNVPENVYVRRLIEWKTKWRNVCTLSFGLSSIGTLHIASAWKLFSIFWTARRHARGIEKWTCSKVKTRTANNTFSVLSYLFLPTKRFENNESRFKGSCSSLIFWKIERKSVWLFANFLTFL